MRLYNDYYPFGMTITPGTTGTNDYRYGYQGQYAGKDPETDWNAFELRMYDSKIARWPSVDPKGQFHSPYVAMGNNSTNSTVIQQAIKISLPQGHGRKHGIAPEIMIADFKFLSSRRKM